LNVRRRCFLPLAAVSAALAVSCGPNEQAQTVSFVLSIEAERLNEIEFVVSYESGKFASTDGQCVVSSAAGPRAAGVSEASLIEADDLKMMTRRERRLRSVARGVEPTTTTTTTSSSSTTSSTDEPPTTTLPTTTTTTLPPTTTTTTSVPTTTIPGPCGNGDLNSGEECDDNNNTAGDGCSADCQLEYFFSASDNDAGALTIRIVNPAGIPPGAALAFCKFQGDIAAAELAITTTDCGRTSGGNCTPTTHAKVTLSTTTTTTTTTKTTTTTLADGDTTTTSSTLDESTLADEPVRVRASRKRR
jgi:cysteine-rich repeat protein